MITKRGSTFYLRKQVPKAYRGSVGRAEVWVSLRTKDPVQARRKAPDVEAELIAEWNALQDGERAQAVLRHNRARELAQRIGLPGGYQVAVDLAANAPVEELLSRIEMLSGHEGDKGLKDAVLGEADQPQVKLSEVLAEYEKAKADEFVEGDDLAKRKHMNPRSKAVRDFIECLDGRDISIDQITGADMRAFRDSLLDRVRGGEIVSETARKNLLTFRSTVRTVSEFLQLDLSLPFDGIGIAKGEAAKVPHYSDAFIRDTILADGALDRLNDEARCILTIMINTGARPSEIAGLKVKHCVIQAEVPMIDIAPDGRRLKTKNSKRKIPLAGVSLDAAQEALSAAVNAGRATDDWLFPRYAGKASLSATVNSYLDTNGLKETPDHTMYSLRHAFSNRLVASGAQDRVHKDLMGHAESSPRYGDGGGDQVRLAAVKAISFA